MASQNNYVIYCLFETIDKTTSDWELADLSNVAQVLIAFANMYLVYHVFTYEKKYRKTSKDDEDVKNTKSIKIQGFKDFVVTPNFSHLQDFFINLLTLKQKITSPIINDALSIELNNFIKSEVSKFRINFNDTILNVNRDLFDNIKVKIENLNDKLILVISDGHYDLTDPNLFQEHISSPINYTKNEIVALLISYKGD